MEIIATECPVPVMNMPSDAWTSKRFRCAAAEGKLAAVRMSPMGAWPPSSARPRRGRRRGDCKGALVAVKGPGERPSKQILATREGLKVGFQSNVP